MNIRNFIAIISALIIILLIGLAIKFTPLGSLISHRNQQKHTQNEIIDEHADETFDYRHIQQIAQEKAGAVGEVDLRNFDPTEYLITWNFNNLPPEEREHFYKESRLPNGTLQREYWFTAIDKEIEIAPGIFFPAWTYNGQVPAPTIRATEGDHMKIHLVNGGTKPHTMHFHGFHSAEMDGAMSHDFIHPGETFIYEFDAEPFGVHLFHCHSVPISQHISKGLYGAYIVDPKKDTRPKPDKELIMVMNGFDTNFDEENEIYAVNTIAFHYVKHPITVKAGELVRIYLINMLEFDQINSFHVHANFFDEYKTGTSLSPDSFTDTVIMGQGERSILDIRFRFPGTYMFHAHKSEFAEKGWMGFFEVIK